MNIFEFDIAVKRHGESRTKDWNPSESARSIVDALEPKTSITAVRMVDFPPVIDKKKICEKKTEIYKQETLTSIFAMNNVDTGWKFKIKIIMTHKIYKS